MKKFLLSCMFVAVVAVMASLIQGCGGGGDGSAVAPEASGRLTLGVTDAPVDGATAVVVKFTAIELKPENGNAFSVDLRPAQSIDLLALAGGGSRPLLQDHAVPTGRYEWVRLIIEAGANEPSSYIDLENGGRFPLIVPSGSESGLKLIRGFTVAAGSASNFVIDFDLRKSVVAPPGQAPNYLLKPVLRMVDNLQVGAIAGTVAAALIGPACSPHVYIFAGAGVVPDDLDATVAPDVDPLISVPVTLDTNTGEYRYRASFIEVGTYTASFTCDGSTDSPEGEEVLVFTGTRDVVVASGQIAAASFDP